MKWTDYQIAIRQTYNLFNDGQTWIQTEVECPKCGKFLYKNMSLVLTSYPPKYQYKCSNCKWFQTGY